jgi:hypothetical protein
MIDLFDGDLRHIDAEMTSVLPSDVPRLFQKIPLDIFGELLLDISLKYPNIKAFFPSMASEQVQKNWTGAHGSTLLLQSTAFVKTLLYGYTEITGRTIENAKILDFGCGWGRIIRLLYKFTSFENIYAVDPWDESIKLCKENGLKAHLALSEWVPNILPFPCHYDLIYAFSVFTHLSEKTAHTALRTLRSYISEEGVLVITIRPKEYWYIHNEGTLASEMTRMHDEKGFAYTPHNRPPIENDITYGDTSISMNYFYSNFPQWKIACVDYNLIDPYQVILFLKPA